MEGIQNPGVMTPTGLKFGKIVVSSVPLPCYRQLQSDGYHFECSLSQLHGRKVNGEVSRKSKVISSPSAFFFFFFLHTHGHSVSLFY